MIVIYTKAEVQKIMKSHYEATHYGDDSHRPIVDMTMAANQLTIKMGHLPEKEDSDD